MSNLPDPLPPAITWKNTLYCEYVPEWGSFDEAIGKSGYPYYCLYGEVYESATSKKLNITERDLDNQLL